MPESAEEREARYNPRVVSEWREHSLLAGEIAEALIGRGRDAADADASVAEVFFLSPDIVHAAREYADPNDPISAEEAAWRRHEPLLACEIVDLWLAFGAPREAAVLDAAGLFGMRPEKLADFYAWLNDEEPGDAALFVGPDAVDVQEKGVPTGRIDGAAAEQIRDAIARLPRQRPKD